MSGKPKRPLSAYMLWLQETKESIKTENPGIKAADLSKRAGELWRSLADKSQWEICAAELKEKYKKDLSKFEITANRGTLTDRRLRKRKTNNKKAPLAKKRKKCSPAARHTDIDADSDEDYKELEEKSTDEFEIENEVEQDIEEESADEFGVENDVENDQENVFVLCLIWFFVFILSFPFLFRFI